MPLRRPVALLLTLVALAATGCSGSDEEQARAAGTPAATAPPSAVGDRPLVVVVEEGAEPLGVLSFDLESGATSESSLVVDQDLVRDQSATQVPPITVPFATTVTGVDDDLLATTRTFAEPTIDATGVAPDAVSSVRDALGALGGSVSELSVRRDGTSVVDTSGVEAAAQVDSQIRDLVPVLPTQAVGVGARWTATSINEIGGATVDQVATYTLDSVEGSAYVIDVVIEQIYRAGEIGGTELRSGRATVTARLEGDLGSLLPTSATGNGSTQVSYVVDGGVTEVRTTVALTLTTA